MRHAYAMPFRCRLRGALMFFVMLIFSRAMPRRHAGRFRRYAMPPARHYLRYAMPI